MMTSPRHENPSVLDWVVAFILLTSAGLKALSPREVAIFAASYDVPIISSLLLIEFEGMLAVMQLSRVGILVRFMSAIAFSAFGCISAYRALSGFDSCGCFGSVKVHPWLTTVLNFALASTLAFTTIGVNRLRFVESFRWRQVTRLFPIIAIPLAVIWYSNRPTRIEDSGSGFDDSGLVIVEPTEWLGKSFPLEGYCEPNPIRAKTEQLLLFYHHDCQECQRVIPRYVALAEKKFVRLIEIPPFGRPPRDSQALHVQLDPNIEWFCEAPVEVTVKDGVVTKTRNREELQQDASVR